MEVFDFWQWSAPLYPDPKAVIRAFPKLRGKKLRQLRIPGLCRALGGSYPSSDPMLPCQGIFYGPLQLVFHDGSTFEFLPMARGGARMGTNTLPKNLEMGMNANGCDAQLLFGQELVDRSFGKCPISIRMTQFTDYQAVHTDQPPLSSLLKGEAPMGCRHSTSQEYHYSLWFDGGLRLELQMGQKGIEPAGYQLRLLCADQLLTVPAQLMLEAMQNREQLPLTPGYGICSAIQIRPCLTENGKTVSWSKLRGDYPNYACSVEEGCCLEGLFARHLTGYDTYGSNLYSLDAAYALLADVRRAGEDTKEMPLARDLYRRFARVLEGMLTQSQKDGCNGLLITGP